MDIQVSSNFERLLFEMNGRDGGITAEQLGRFRSTGRLDIEPDQRAEFLDGFASVRPRSTTTTRWTRSHGSIADTGMLLDPHTATGTAAAAMLSGLDRDDHPIVTLAHRAPGEVPRRGRARDGRASGTARPHLADLFERPERTQTVPTISPRSRRSSIDSTRR